MPFKAAPITLAFSLIAIANLASADIRLLSKLAAVREVGGDSERRTGMYTTVPEDSSTDSTNKFPTAVGFGKKSIANQENSPVFATRPTIAVGGYQPPTGLATAAILSNRLGGWNLESVDSGLKAYKSELTSISWNGTGWVAAGAYEKNGVSAPAILANSSSDGSGTWHLQPTDPLLANFNTSIHGLSSNGRVWMLTGSYYNGSRNQALLLNNSSPSGVGTWHMIPLSNFGSQNSELKSIQWSGNAWIAVGDYTNATTHTQQGLILTNPNSNGGGVWTIHALPPQLANLTSNLTSISWNGTTWAIAGTATNYQQPPTNNTQGIILTNIHPDGSGAWTLQTLPPALATYNNSFNGINWNGSVWLANGWYGTNNPFTLTTPIAAANGNDWTFRAIPPLTANGDTIISSMSWNGNNWTAVGFYLTNSGVFSGAILTNTARDASSQWIHHPTPALGTVSSGLSGVF